MLNPRRGPGGTSTSVLEKENSIARDLAPVKATTTVQRHGLAPTTKLDNTKNLQSTGSTRRVLGNITNRQQGTQRSQGQKEKQAQTKPQVSMATTQQPQMGFPREIETMHSCNFIPEPQAAAMFGCFDVRVLASKMLLAEPRPRIHSRKIQDPEIIQMETPSADPMLPPLPPADDIIDSSSLLFSNAEPPAMMEMCDDLL